MVIRRFALWCPDPGTHGTTYAGLLGLFVHYQEDGNNFLFQIETRDESWVFHFTLEAKITSMEWKNPSLSVRKKFKTTPSAGKRYVHKTKAEGGVLIGGTSW
ncbi:hypothetical protein TNIN_170711 [Trichonephila inaurata madagascariensis]|uniref:Uncharacterized protein n=1 Tax=Trichonephila inaurata madagascariensis TaxID=2747483 RepID=A0A8X6Y2W3_9ARAC|nr:hypothetical protein TNIN_170711 [Trichonephila inaurata madagascariensis]